MNDRIKKHCYLLLVFLHCSFCMHATADQVSSVLQTNAMSIHNAPAWVSRSKAEKVAQSIEQKLEWSIRRIDVYWHANETTYLKSQSLGVGAVAATIKSKNQTVHMGPQVNEQNWEQVLGHELVHVILAQKYKKTIPSWIEEGLANHLSKRAKVNYKMLAKEAPPTDLRDIGHPFRGSKAKISYYYQVSQALAEMLDKKCDLRRLVQISMKEDKGMDFYLKTFCSITDLNSSYRDWITKNSR
jgi:hypothetical protein